MTAPAAPVCVVEDDAAVAASLDAVLQSWGYLVRLFPSAEAYLDAAEDEAGCLLLDVRLPGMDGLALLEAIRGRGDAVPVVVMTGHGDIAMAVRAMQLGAQDFIEKPFDDEDLVRRLRMAIARGGRDDDCRQRLARLTPRESDVLREVVAGHANKVIAHRLGISKKTVELHRARVMEKTGANSLSHLVRIALKGGLEVEDPA